MGQPLEKTKTLVTISQTVNINRKTDRAIREQKRTEKPVTKKKTDNQKTTQGGRTAVNETRLAGLGEEVQRREDLWESRLRGGLLPQEWDRE